MTPKGSESQQQTEIVDEPGRVTEKDRKCKV